MLIGIDGNEANIKNRVGVNVYAFEILQALHKLQVEQKIQHKFIVYLKNSPRKDMPAENDFFKYKVLSGGKIWIITKLMPNLYFDSPRPEFFLSLSHYIPPLSPVERICSIMDLGYLNYSEHFKKYDFWQLKLWTAWSIFFSKKIIAISESTKKDIVRHYKFASKKIHVIHLAYDKHKFNSNANKNDVRRVTKKYHIDKNYILFLSTLKPSKNVEGLIEAFKIVVNKFPDYQLVIAGKKGWLFESIFRKVKVLGLQDKVIFTDFVEEEDKPGLIKGAKVFCLPSFWEGFGLDVLNALSSGVLVIVSDKGSLPEVGGKAAIYVDPNNPRDIANSINKVLSMSKLEYNKLRMLGISQAEKFTWQATAEGILRMLEN